MSPSASALCSPLAPSCVGRPPASIAIVHHDLQPAAELIGVSSVNLLLSASAPAMERRSWIPTRIGSEAQGVHSHSHPRRCLPRKFLLFTRILSPSPYPSPHGRQVHPLGTRRIASSDGDTLCCLSYPCITVGRTLRTRACARKRARSELSLYSLSSYACGAISLVGRTVSRPAHAVSPCDCGDAHAVLPAEASGVQVDAIRHRR